MKEGGCGAVRGTGTPWRYCFEVCEPVTKDRKRRTFQNLEQGRRVYSSATAAVHQDKKGNLRVITHRWATTQPVMCDVAPRHHDGPSDQCQKQRSQPREETHQRVL